MRPSEKKTFFPTSATEFLKKSLPPKAPIIKGLLHHRDLVALGARRRHGKTNFAINLALSLAEGEGDFLGYPIAKAAKTLLVLIEDDPFELQQRLRKHLGEDAVISDRITVVTREDFAENGVKVDIGDKEFQRLLELWAKNQKPDVIVLDNLSFLIGAQFNDAERMHAVTTFVYKLARNTDAAVVVAAHPRKDTVDPKTKRKHLTLEHDTDLWFEQLMGSSHFINAMPSLWGLERDRKKDTTVFVGGRQRVDGSQHVMNIAFGENGRLTLVNDFAANFARTVNTDKREGAWNALPNPPTTFSYSEAEKFIAPHLKSSSSRAEWLAEVRRLGLLVEPENGRLMKATNPAMKEAVEVMAESFPGPWIDGLSPDLTPEKYKNPPDIKLVKSDPVEEDAA
jgi:AAA domain